MPSWSILAIWVPWALHSLSASSICRKGLANGQHILNPFLTVFQFQDTGEGTELHGCRVLDGLRSLVHTIIGTCLSLFLLFGNNFGLNSLFSNFFNFYSSLEIDHDPHVHMTYVYSLSYVYISYFTQSHGQEKSLSYYDLFDFGVLFYGHIPTLISFFHPFYPTTPILTIEIFIIGTNLQEDMGRPRCMERKILNIWWRTLLGPH